MAVILLSSTPCATASATPGEGVEVETLSQATVDGQDYVTKQITIAPGGSTGWHWHPGRVFGVIREGTLTHDMANCTEDGSYPAGSPVTEGTGPDNVHIGRGGDVGVLHRSRGQPAVQRRAESRLPVLVAGSVQLGRSGFQGLRSAEALSLSACTGWIGMPLRAAVASICSTTFLPSALSPGSSIG
jgi:hypothetical protein